MEEFLAKDNIINRGEISFILSVRSLRATDGGADETKALSPGMISWTCLNTLLLAFIVVGNSMTIIAVRTCRRLRAIISNLFISSLAISDLIVGVTLPFHLAFYLQFGIEKSHILCMLRFFFIIFACCVSLLTLITIAIDRYIAVLYALHYRRFMTRRVAFYIIAFNWFIGASVALIPMFWNHWNTASQCEYYQVLPSWYMVGMITPGFIIIWTVMLMLYYRIMKEASKQAQQMKNSNCILARQKSSSTDWKSMQIVVIIMGCFSVCWLPYFIVACAQIFGIYSTNTLLYKIVFSLAMTNSGLNPIIYAWKNSNFRRAFALLIRCKSPNTRSIYMEGGSICSHRLPRQNSNMSIGGVSGGDITAPSISLTSNTDFKFPDTNNNNNNNNHKHIKDIHLSRGPLSIKDNVSEEDTVNVVTIEKIHQLRENDTTSTLSGQTIESSTNIECPAKSKTTHNAKTEITIPPENCDAISTGTTESITHKLNEECASCGVYKNILRKSIRFKDLFLATNPTNKIMQ